MFVNLLLKKDKGLRTPFAFAEVLVSVPSICMMVHSFIK